MTLQQQIRRDFKKSPASAVYYLVLLGYLYYVHDVSVVEDEMFDKMAKTILERNIKHSKLSHLITDDDLRAGSLYAIAAKNYPAFIIDHAYRIMREMK